MFVIVHAQKLVFPSVLILALMLSYRAYQHRHLWRPTLTWLSAGTTLLLIGVSSTLVTKYSAWAHLILDATLYIGLLLIYWSIRHVLSGEPPPPSLLRSPSFLATVLVSALAIGLDTIRMISKDAFQTRKLPTLNYPRTFPADGLTIEWGAVVGYYLLHNLIQLIFVSLIIVTYVRTMQRHTDVTYLARRLICLLGFLIAAIGMVSVTIGIVAWTMSYTSIHATLIRVYQIGKICALVVIAFGFLVPHRWLIWMTTPVRQLVVERRQQQDLLVAYLHAKMTQITPAVRLVTDDERLGAIRVPIEISDARQLIWSQIARAQPITPRVEAEYLAQLLRAHRVIGAPGPHPPPPTRDRDVHRHNLATAWHLQRLLRA
jgi:hypothetical protein